MVEQRSPKPSVACSSRVSPAIAKGAVKKQSEKALRFIFDTSLGAFLMIFSLY